MKLLVITTCDNKNNTGWLKLEASLKRFEYDYECIVHPFTFGTQLNVIKKWADNYTGDATHILYTDAFDTVALGPLQEVIDKFDMAISKTGYTANFPHRKMLISAEKNCYPHPERAGDYPETTSAWKYVNGGGWIAEIEYFKYLCNKENLNPGSHDQVWLMEAYLHNQSEIKLDTQCEIFQSIAFSNLDEWYASKMIGQVGINETNGKIILGETGIRLTNVVTRTQPIFFHGNGHTEMDWVYKILE